MNGPKLKKSFKFASQGFYKILLSEQNIKVHIAITGLVIALGIIFRINYLEWSCVLLVIGLVLCTEIINTAIEKMLDYLYPKDRRTPEQDRIVGVVKDTLAGAVLVAAVISVIIGLLIFLPYLLKYF